MDFKMITILTSFLYLLMCFLPIYDARIPSTEYFKVTYGEYATYYESTCLGSPLCNSTIVRPTNVDKGFIKCSCDSDCSLYGDCCPDSQTKNGVNKIFSCVPKMPYYVVNTCPTSFTDTVTRTKCENTSVGVVYEDTKVMRPVMDPKSRVTYLNAYCASCNNIANYEQFGLSYTCSVIHSERDEDTAPEPPLAKILSKAQFNHQLNLFTSTIDGSIYKCTHKIVIPTHLEPYLKNCLPNIISSCPKGFKDSQIIEKCQSFTYIVYDNPLMGEPDFYRNEYCAMCNGVDKIIQCQTLSKRSGGHTLWTSSTDGGTCSDPIIKTLPVCT